MENEIKYSDLSLIGRELFRKNNDKFMRSNLSPIMSKIFIAANIDSNITDTESEYYMKSGILPNKIFYIYSDQLTEKNPCKIYDIVNFNGQKCIWFYSNNVINCIDKHPVSTIIGIYSRLLSFFKTAEFNTFMNIENNIVLDTMVIGFINFLHETYGVLDMDICKKSIINIRFEEYTEESAINFINNVLENYNNTSYYDTREYLVSYLLLKKDKTNTEDQLNMLLV